MCSTMTEKAAGPALMHSLATSFDRRPTISFAGTRLSEQPIHRQRGP